MYKIMKTTLQLSDRDDFIPNAVGVFRLAYAPVSTLIQLIQFASQKAPLSGATLQSCSFTGPELLGLVTLDHLDLKPDQEMDFFAHGFFAIPLSEKMLDKLHPIDSESIEVTSGGKLSWHCTHRLNTYQVFGAPLAVWQSHQEEIMRQEIAAARKKPLSWKEARRTVMHSRTEGIHIAMWVDDDNIKEIMHAIRVTLRDDRCQLSHIQKAQLEATLMQAVSDV